MKVNKLHQDFKEFYKGSDTKYSLFFEFEQSDEVQKIMRMFKKGYWSAMPFGFNRKDVVSIKLSPSYSIEDSPLVKFSNITKVCTTIAPNLKRLLPMCALDYIDDEEIFIELQDDINEILKQATSFQKHVNGEHELEFYKDYLLNKENLLFFKNTPKEREKFYIDFWNHYNKSPEQEKTVTLLKKLLEDQSYLPDYEEIDYGIWNTYIYNSLAGRANSKLRTETKDLWEYYWRGVQQPHGFDAMGMVVDGVKPSLNKSKSNISGLSSFNSSWEEEYDCFPKEVQEHPIFHATESIRIKGDAYIGEEHVLAAAILDEKYNDPIGAWNALVSAGYWAGLNESPAVEVIWETAIYLAEKHNWTEIHEVLVQQYEYYNFYKDKV